MSPDERARLAGFAVRWSTFGAAMLLIVGLLPMWGAAVAAAVATVIVAQSSLTARGQRQ